PPLTRGRPVHRSRETHPHPPSRGATHPLSLDPPVSSSPGLPIHSQSPPVPPRWSRPSAPAKLPLTLARATHPLVAHPFPPRQGYLRGGGSPGSRLARATSTHMPT